MNKKWGFINHKGVEISPFKYHRVGDFSDGLASACLRNTNDFDKWGFINQFGEEVITLKYEEVSNFSEGVAKAKLKNKYGFIDEFGREIIPHKYSDAKSFSEELAYVSYISRIIGVEIKSGHYFIDKKGKIIIDLKKYWLIGTFQEGLAWVCTGANSPVEFIDKTGDEIIPLQFDSTSGFNDGLAAVKGNYKWGFINKTGTRVIPIKYNDVRAFSENLTFVKLESKWGVIDKSGDGIISPKYEDVYSYSEGLACVKLNDKWGYINKKDEEVIPFKYENTSLNKFNNGLAYVRFDKTWFCIGQNGTEYYEP